MECVCVCVCVSRVGVSVCAREIERERGCVEGRSMCDYMRE